VRNEIVDARTGDPAPDARPAVTSVSVVIPAFTMKRWERLRKGVESVRAQSVPVHSVVVCVDNNEELLARAKEEWGDSAGVPVVVVPNRHRDHLDRVSAHQAAHGTTRRFGAGSARNTASEQVDAEVIAFMDDDAWAEPDWLEQLLRVFQDPGVVAVGGAPLPEYEETRPDWFPPNFDWVFGCAYEGLPTDIAPLKHLIGANMSVRRSAWSEVGGFLGSDFDDLNLCMRLLERFGRESVVYNPFAVNHHYVTADRTTWRYFWRRCYFVNREKVRVLSRIGTAANLTAEREFVLRSLTAQALRLGRATLRGDLSAPKKFAAMTAGIVLAALGYLRGRADQITRGQSREVA
jgi:cellulose synthase/poly-beta-1,6-N-acetylglucosamine synthase-like glycosyltransferase